MISKIKIIFVLTLISTSVFAQIGTAFYVGTGTYDMGLQKYFHKDIYSSFSRGYGIDMMLLDNFPSYYNYAGEVFFPVSKDVQISFGVMYMSTGARSYYQDYSGSVSFDIEMEGVGPYFSITQNIMDNIFDIDLKLSPQLIFTKQSIDSELSMGSYVEKESIKLNAKNIGIEPAIVIRKYMRSFTLSVHCGYYFDVLRGNMKTNEGNNEVFIPSTNEQLKTAWDGVRLRFGLAYTFSE